VFYIGLLFQYVFRESRVDISLSRKKLVVNVEVACKGIINFANAVKLRNLEKYVPGCK
jgi:hypothetical protein